MSESGDNDATRGGRQSHEEEMLVFEFSVPANQFVLGGVLQAFPDVVVEFERLVPTNYSPFPYLWLNDDVTGFDEAVDADAEVDSVRQVATFDSGVLYHIRWDCEEGNLLNWIDKAHDDVSLLHSEGSDGKWTLKLRFPGRDRFEEFRKFYDEEGINLRVVRLYELEDPKMGQYNVTKKQREALVRALEMGHFEIPREATLNEIADTLDISPKALSERLRRGQTNLVSNSLTIGRPPGIGVSEE